MKQILSGVSGERIGVRWKNLAKAYSMTDFGQIREPIDQIVNCD
jgi:hypothetical protein